jgi:hypothetical protein
LVEAAFEICAHDACGRLRPQRQLSAPAVLEPIKLLGDGVGVLAHPLDQLLMLDDRGHDLLVAEPRRDLGRGPLGGAPQRTIAWKDVANAADSPDWLGARHVLEF